MFDIKIFDIITPSHNTSSMRKRVKIIDVTIKVKTSRQNGNGNSIQNVNKHQKLNKIHNCHYYFLNEE